MDDHLTPNQAASALLAELGESTEAFGHPVFVRLRPGLTLEGLSRRHDVWGWTAPATDAAVGVVATARLRSLDESAEIPARLRPGLGGGIRTSCLVTREGEIGWDMRLPDGSYFRETPSEGRMLDVLRRTLGLATPPPQVPPGRLVAIIWLLTIDRMSRHWPGRMNWSDVLDANLGAGQMAEAVPDADGETLIRVLASRRTWEDYRQTTVALGERGLCDPALAAWMDEGMFCRYVLGELPPLEQLLAEVRPRLVPAAARRLGHLVHDIASPTRVMI
jgi:hypothetical protein